MRIPRSSGGDKDGVEYVLVHVRGDALATSELDLQLIATEGTTPYAGSGEDPVQASAPRKPLIYGG